MTKVLRHEVLTFREQLLLVLDDDGLDPFWIYQIAEPYNSGDAESIRQQCIGAVAELLTDETVSVADFAGEDWDCSPGDAIVRITRDWLASAPSGKPDYGTIAWLTVTEHGRALTSAAVAKLDKFLELDPSF